MTPAGRPPWKPPDIPPDVSPLGIHVGTAGYSFADWAGHFYPPRAPPGEERAAGRDLLPCYQLYFSFLELGHTFYREPQAQECAELERRSKPGMRFSMKVHRDISHGGWDAALGKARMLRHAAAVTPLAESGRFYSFLIQLDERAERSRKALDYLLATASAALGEGLDVHVEFRHRTWHQEAVLRALQDAGVGLCNPDLPYPQAFPLKAYATSKKGYLRYYGRNAAAWAADEGGPAERLQTRQARNDYLYSEAELRARIQGQLRLWDKTGAVAVVFKNHVRGQAARNAARNARLMASARSARR